LHISSLSKNGTGSELPKSKKELVLTIYTVSLSMLS
jgi:hypothetical protein